MRRTRHIALPVRAWQYMGLLVVSLACLTLGVVARDKEGRAGSLAGPELQHRAPHDMDICPNLAPFTKMPSCSSLEQDQTRISKTTRDSRSSPSELRRSRSLDRVSRIQPAARRSSDSSIQLSRLRTTEDLNRQNRIIESRERRFARSTERSNDLRRERNDRRAQLTIRRDSRLDRRSFNRLDAERRDSVVRSRNSVRDERWERNNRLSASEISRKQEQRRVGDLSDRRTSMDSRRVLEKRDIRHVSRNDLKQRTGRTSLDDRRSERRVLANSRSSERLSVESRIREDGRRVEQRTDRGPTTRRLAERIDRRADLRTDRIRKEQRSERGLEYRGIRSRLVGDRTDRRLTGRKFDRLAVRTDRIRDEQRFERGLEHRDIHSRLVGERTNRRLIGRKLDRLNVRTERLMERRTDRLMDRKTDRLMEQRTDRRLTDQRADRRLTRRSDRSDERLDRRLIEKRVDRRLDQRADRKLMERRITEQRADRRDLDSRRLQRLDIRLKQSRVFNLASKDIRSNQREQRLAVRNADIKRVRSTENDSRFQKELINESLLRRHRDSGIARLLAAREKLIRNNDFTRVDALSSADILKGKNPISNVLTFEVIRQAIVVGLCTMYGLSIFYGKRSFIRNLVNQAPRYIVW
ncbi:trichohyalin [Ceratina calcarata]|uniref:Trichohyalin n=1 Tax=Ceratina calcarata TaxID=156304 RepID=A0AAJ7N9Z9_9HYME|nr:trichohyalin [Ceratina calcarata]